MITKLRLHNFKTFLNFEIDLTRYHLLIGKNNSGKTNLCSALRFLRDTAFLDYDKIVVSGGLNGFTHWPRVDPLVRFECTCELPFQGQCLAYEYKLHLEAATTMPMPGSGQSALRTQHESLTVRGPSFPEATLIKSDGQSVQLLHETRHLKQQGEPFVDTRAPSGSSMLSKLYELETNPRAILFRRFLGSLTYCSLSAPLMRHGWSMSSDASVISASMEPYGANLPFSLFQLKNENEPKYRTIVEYAAQLEPDLDSINFFVSPDNKPTPYVILKGNRRTSWDSLSDGTLYVIGLATIFAMTGRWKEAEGWPPTVAIIEEPENGLYCGLLREIWESLTTQGWQTQIITTAHNPYFIDLFDRDLESVSYLRKEGQVTTRTPLTEKREIIEKYRGDFSLGELHFKEVFE